MLYCIVGLLVIILDQAVKFWVTNTLFGSDIVKFIPGLISLVNVHNDGAAFSFLSGGGARIYFIVLTAVFALLVIVALATNFISGRVSRWCLVLITAGGLANCIDRVIYGYVVDMFKVEIFNFAVFNVADIFITVFAIIFAIAMIFERQDDDDEDDYDDEEEDDNYEEKPKRRKLFSRRERDMEDDIVDEDEDEVLPARRARKPRNAEPEIQPSGHVKPGALNEPGRKTRKPNYSKEYEQYKAERAARERNAAPAQAKPAAPADNDNPFAEWERANARVDSQRGSSPAARAMGANPPSYNRAPAAQAKVAAQPQAPAEVKAPVQPEVKAPAPERAKAPAKVENPVASVDFDLDDILNEFK